MGLLNEIAASISATRIELYWARLIGLSETIYDAILTEDNQSFIVIEAPIEGDFVYYLQQE